ncbi:MAG: SDR family oxidoreductase [Rhodospirillales bacterium]|jgi:3-oxoacyl-[acyl-carrier protein] reductase|nr:SDR family oxidoreductase [Rhodospirillales bacterium]
MDVRLNGRSAIVTGGSLGIGRAVAERFALSGANVAIVGRRADLLNEACEAIRGQAATKVIAIPGDVSRADDCAHIFRTASEVFGQVDILVNNAGSSKKGKFTEITDEEWNFDLQLKLFAAIRLCRLAIPPMQARRWGRIINVLNIGAKAPLGGAAPTAVSRAAGMALTKILAGEFAADNVLVNALLVGRIRSDQWVKRAESEGKDIEAFYAEMGETMPLGRIGTGEEFANMACFLASEAGSYINGTAINVDGGASPVV